MHTSPTLRSTTEVWELHPPVDVERAYGRPNERRLIRVHYVHRTVTADGAVDHSVRGVTLTAKGTPSSGIGWRTPTDAELAALVARLPAMVHAVDTGPEPEPYDS